MRRLLLVPGALLCGFLAPQIHAQSPYVVSPAGVDLVELGSSSSIVLNWGGNSTTRVQQADQSMVGLGRSFESISWRRHGRYGRMVAWTPTLSIHLGESDFATFSASFSGNVKGSLTQVFGGSLRMDWRASSQLPVGEWKDATFPFSAPYVYSGADAMLWETRTTSKSAISSDYSVDWGSVPPSIRSSLIPGVLGKGCAIGSGTVALETSYTVDDTPESEWSLTLTGGPMNAPVSIFLGENDPDLPFLCGRLHSDALVSFPIGLANGMGSLYYTKRSPWLPMYAGVDLTVQAFAFDPSVPGGGYLSNGLQLHLPRVAGGTAFEIKRIYSTTSSTDTTASTGVSLSCQATRFK